MSSSRHTARKRFGQNFLQDPGVVSDIIHAANLSADDHVIEIGPGHGALTRMMLDQAKSVTAIEIDRDLAAELTKTYAGMSTFTLIAEDVLKTDWTRFLDKDTKPKLVANLPYNISSPLFFKLTRYRDKIDSAVIMVQKELADRLCHAGESGMGLKDYGVLSIVATNAFTVSKVRDVSPGSFTPRPKVHSTVVRLEPKPRVVDDEDGFFRFVQRCFSARRKLMASQLRKNEPELYERLSESTRERLGAIRPENLNPSEFVNLFLGKEL